MKPPRSLRSLPPKGALSSKCGFATLLESPRGAGRATGSALGALSTFGTAGRY
jgi:hypothetical protein